MAGQVNKWHILEPKDRARIHCMECDKAAYACEHVEWNTGNTSGISFFCYCRAHAIERGFNEER